MAVPASFDESNAVLGKPADMTDDECEALSVLMTQCYGLPVVISCWKLTAEEAREVARTGRVWLGIYGETMPPAFVAGRKPFLIGGGG